MAERSENAEHSEHSEHSEHAEHAEHAEHSEHSEHSELVDRADSLMRGGGSALARRRRSFIAAPAKATPGAAPTPSEDDGLPVLTEVVSAASDEAESAVSGDSAEAKAKAKAKWGREKEATPSEAVLSTLAVDLAKRLERQLAVELPTLIEATLLNAQNELLAGVHTTLELALRNFLASRNLPPPPDPSSGRDADV